MALQSLNEGDVWYHVYPLGFLAAETENPVPSASDGPVAHGLPELIGWLDYLVDYAADEPAGGANSNWWP